MVIYWIQNTLESAGSQDSAAEAKMGVSPPFFINQQLPTNFWQYPQEKGKTLSVTTDMLKCCWPLFCHLTVSLVALHLELASYLNKIFSEAISFAVAFCLSPLLLGLTTEVGSPVDIGWTKNTVIHHGKCPVLMLRNLTGFLLPFHGVAAFRNSVLNVGLSGSQSGRQTSWWWNEKNPTVNIKTKSKAKQDSWPGRLLGCVRRSYIIF